MSKVAFTELRPGDARDPAWVNDLFDGLAASSAEVSRTNFRPNGIRKSSFVSVTAGYRPVDGVDNTSIVTIAWPMAWAAFPAGLATSITDSFVIPPHATLRVRLGFEFIDTYAAFVVSPSMVAPALAQWRIGGTIGGVAWSDDFSEMWLGLPAAAAAWASGSAYTEAFYDNDTDDEIEVTLLEGQCQETTGAVIRAGNVVLYATIFQRVVE